MHKAVCIYEYNLINYFWSLESPIRKYIFRTFVELGIIKQRISIIINCLQFIFSAGCQTLVISVTHNEIWKINPEYLINERIWKNCILDIILEIVIKVNFLNHNT